MTLAAIFPNVIVVLIEDYLKEHPCSEQIKSRERTFYIYGNPNPIILGFFVPYKLPLRTYSDLFCPYYYQPKDEPKRVCSIL